MVKSGFTQELWQEGKGDISTEPKTLKNNKEILQTISVHKFDSLDEIDPIP